MTQAVAVTGTLIIFGMHGAAVAVPWVISMYFLGAFKEK